MDSLISKLGRNNNTSPRKRQEGQLDSNDVNYKDRLDDQAEIKQFLDLIFSEYANGSKTLTFKQYVEINKMVSSEMFYSMMALLHRQLPCAQGYFKLKKTYQAQKPDSGSSKMSSIASPTMIRGLSHHSKGSNMSVTSTHGLGSSRRELSFTIKKQGTI